MNRTEVWVSGISSVSPLTFLNHYLDVKILQFERILLQKSQDFCSFAQQSLFRQCSLPCSVFPDHSYPI